MSSSVAADDAVLRNVLDRLEIQELSARYNDAAREFDADRYAALFTEDGVYRHLPSSPLTKSPYAGGMESRGRDALRKMVRSAKEANGDMPRGLQHLTSDFEIEVDGDSATSKCVMIVYGRFAPDEPNRVDACGLYNDRLARTPDGWRYLERESLLWHAQD
jgi:ketosteroid isomerase-like protein